MFNKHTISALALDIKNKAANIIYSDDCGLTPEEIAEQIYELASDIQWIAKRA